MHGIKLMCFGYLFLIIQATLLLKFFTDITDFIYNLIILSASQQHPIPYIVMITKMVIHSSQFYSGRIWTFYAPIWDISLGVSFEQLKICKHKKL